ncbi:hypothetical protein SAY86_011709 [Trapa natans]|uniref:TCP domain-containing protein n=1 Tax=Trapa natans TaxID=22666 RepID=A0AAN7R5C6_TRANT|nr:hypothetical protein SAY86_011709 [Trapa natans]
MKSGTSNGGGEIVQVQGGHIIRSTGRKDRHSKVYTSKGPRDRRVRLSANTAIQFYDVQDRLGFDRPSKAVDWLIKKAKSSIDKLSDLPPWNPSASAGPSAAEDSRSREVPPSQELPSGYAVAGGSSSFMASPRHLDDSDAMKLFFPTSIAVASSCFTGYTVPPEMVARAVHQGEDLGLSLHPFQHSSGGLQSSSNRTIFTSPAESLGPGCSNYPPRLMGWPGGDGTGGAEESRGIADGHGFLMSHQGGSGSGSALMMVNPQRGTLQSSFSGSFDESSIVSMPSDSHHRNNPPVAVAEAHQPPFLSGRFGSDSLTQFYYTSRVHGSSSHDQQHHHGMISDGASSSTSASSDNQ